MCLEWTACKKRKNLLHAECKSVLELIGYEGRRGMWKGRKCRWCGRGGHNTGKCDFEIDRWGFELPFKKQKEVKVEEKHDDPKDVEDDEDEDEGYEDVSPAPEGVYVLDGDKFMDELLKSHPVSKKEQDIHYNQTLKQYIKKAVRT